MNDHENASEILFDIMTVRDAAATSAAKKMLSLGVSNLSLRPNQSLGRQEQGFDNPPSTADEAAEIGIKSMAMHFYMAAGCVNGFSVLSFMG